jgi:uncharacterized protein (TIGR00290 family)
LRYWVKAACLWSGGKDSCLALWKARAQGLEICYLVNFLSAELGRTAFHRVRPDLIQLQSEALGIPLIQRETASENYEQVYRAVMQELRAMGIEGLVTGDIDLAEGRAWVEGNCREFNLEAVMPLWSIAPEEVMGQFIGEGFRALVVCVRADLFGGDWLGRKVDREFVASLHASHSKPGFHICGENGEYHTLVTDGPPFRKRISVARSDKTWRDGYGFLEIDRAELAPKGG